MVNHVLFDKQISKPAKTAPFVNAGSIIYSGLSVREWVRESVNTISQKNNERNFTQFWRQMQMGLWISWLAFGVKRLKIKVTTGNDPKTLWTPYLRNQLGEFHPILVTVVYGFIDMLISLWYQKVKGQGHSRRRHNRRRRPVEFYLVIQCICIIST